MGVRKNFSKELNAGTLVTNAVTNGNFANGTTGWNPAASTLSAANNTLSIIGTNTNSIVSATQATVALSAGKKIYVRAKINVTNAVCLSALLRCGGTVVADLVDVATQSNPVQNTTYTLSGIFTQTTQTGNFNTYIRHIYADAATADGKVMEVQEVIIIDLTAAFGAGNEPTAQQCAALFSSWFGDTVGVRPSLSARSPLRQL